MIPPFNADGNLPPGIHEAGWEEFVRRFGTTPHRLRLIDGLHAAMRILRAAGCRRVFLNGSFVTKKVRPGDFDAVWDPSGVEVDLLLRLEPAFGAFSNRRAAQKVLFGGEFFPSSLTEGATGSTFLEFFQIDKRTGKPKGIVALDVEATPG